MHHKLRFFEAPLLNFSAVQHVFSSFFLCRFSLRDMVEYPRQMIVPQERGVDPVAGLSAVRRFAAGWASGQGSSIELVHSSRVTQPLR